MEEDSYAETPDYEQENNSDREQSNNYSSEHDLQDGVTSHQSAGNKQSNERSSKDEEASNISALAPPSYPQPKPRSLDSKKPSGTASQPNMCNSYSSENDPQCLQSSGISAPASPSFPQPMARSVDSKKPNGTSSQPNMCPSQPPHESSPHSDKKTQSTTHQPESRDEDASTNRFVFHGKPLFDADNVGDCHLTIEDIYIEAMTLAAEIRIHRRHLDDKGQAELSRIMKFCHNALHEKLVISSKRAHEAAHTEPTPKLLKLL